MKVSYNWLKWYIPNAPEPDVLKDILTYHLTEVEGTEKLADGDTIFDINILPNRAHDLLSHSGIGRELSGQLGIPFTDPTGTYTDILKKKNIQETYLEIELDTESCRRYSARIIRNIKIGPSPDWVVKHLESVGQRTINNIVDATNLVMLNCGQPTHAFDLRKFADKRIIVRNAKDDEELELVGKDKIIAKLKKTDLIISNSLRETLALGGVKGGTNSGIQDDTVDIVIEVANFDSTSIRKTARRIGVLSDAAKRFENDLSPELCDFGMLELSALISEMCPDAIFEDVVDVYPRVDEFKNKHTISITSDYVNNKLGGSITNEDIEKIFRNYNFEYELNDDNFILTVPSMRLDLRIKEDLVEEIGRIYGYDKITPIMPASNFIAEDNEIYTKIESIRNDLISKGYREVMTYSLAKKGSVELARATKGKEFLRNNLTDGIKESYELNRLNAPILGDIETKIFEIGNTFNNGTEEIHIVTADKKGIEESKIEEYVPRETNPKKSLHVSSSSFVDASENGANAIFSTWSSYPFMTRDVSVWVPENFDVNHLTNVYENSTNELLARPPYQLDKFSKDGRTSYAYRLVFQAKDRTLVDTEVSQIMQKIEEELKNISGLEIR